MTLHLQAALHYLELFTKFNPWKMSMGAWVYCSHHLSLVPSLPRLLTPFAPCIYEAPTTFQTGKWRSTWTRYNPTWKAKSEVQWWTCMPWACEGYAPWATHSILFSTDVTLVLIVFCCINLAVWNNHNNIIIISPVSWLHSLRLILLKVCLLFQSDSD